MKFCRLTRGNMDSEKQYRHVRLNKSTSQDDGNFLCRFLSSESEKDGKIAEHQSDAKE